MAWPGPAFFGLAWPGFWLQAGAGKSLIEIKEYSVIKAVKQSVVRKPIVAWAIGTCAKMFATKVQRFSHAGSMANNDIMMETAEARQEDLAGFIVPDTFEELSQVLKETEGNVDDKRMYSIGIRVRK